MKTDFSTPLIQRIQALSHPLDAIPTLTPLKRAPLKDVDTILFDVYGTLLISNSGDIDTAAAVDCAEALIQALIVAGYDGNLERAGTLGPELLRAQIEQAHQITRDNGIDWPEVEISQIWQKVVERLQALGQLRPDDDPARVERLAIEYECRVNPVWPMPDALQTLRALRARGFRLGMVSNAQFYTPLTLEALWGQSLQSVGFDETLCAFSYKQRRAKPSVELFRTLDRQVNWNRTLYLGNDMLNDIWTAAQVGCKTCLFAGDRRSLRLRKTDPRCVDLEPDAIIDAPPQIIDLLAERPPSSPTAHL